MGQTEPLRCLWRRCFDDSEEEIDQFFRFAYSPERCRTLDESGQIAAALHWMDCSCGGRKLAYLYAVGTDPDFRCRGLCRALLADTHETLARRGYAGALLVPGDEGLRRMYRRLGYTDCTRVSEWTACAGNPIPLRQVSPEEYAALRREYLPAGGVIQEGEALALLAQWAELYAGEDFVLACAKGRPFAALELLGNRSAAPGILAALGCPEGRFRSPGEGIPFAMFRPLRPSTPAPTYFGLAFD